MMDSYDLGGGADEVRCFIDAGHSAVMTRVFSAGTDPVELTSAEARRLAPALIALAIGSIRTTTPDRRDRHFSLDRTDQATGSLATPTLSRPGSPRSPCAPASAQAGRQRPDRAARS